MTTSIFADFAKVFPERFTNVTNGVTPRRWINIANPGLTNSWINIWATKTGVCIWTT